MNTPLFTPWAGPIPPTESTLMRLCAEQGLQPHSWSNGPHDTYTAHSHSYNKVIYVVSGSITFGLAELKQELTLNSGDRLDLPAGMIHNAVVGAQGVVCLEAYQAGFDKESMPGWLRSGSRPRYLSDLNGNRPHPFDEGG